MPLDAIEILRGAFAGYLVGVGGFGGLTLVWALTRFNLSSEWVAATWFAVAGAGVILTVVLLAWYSFGRSEPFVG